MALLENLSGPLRRFPSHVVSVAEALDGNWTEVPDLFCESARFVAGPELDYASFSWRYGYKQPVGDSNGVRYFYPLDLPGMYVRVEVEGVPESAWWYGVIEDDSRKLEGARQTFKPSGQQTLTAYGFGRLLERQRVTVGSTESYAVERGLTFNGDSTAYGEGGNRSVDVNPLGAYSFTDTRRGGALWTVGDAVAHLMVLHAPANTEWEVDAPAGLLDRPLPPVATDRRPVKEILDEILTRRRGIGYKFQFNPEILKIQLVCFSFADEDVTGADGEVIIPANPTATDMDFENALDVEARILYHHGEVADKIVVEGEYATSTLTLRFNEDIGANWTALEELAYLQAASNETGYDDLELEEQYRRNEAWRARDRLRNVFSRFAIVEDWSQRVAPEGEGETEYFAFPVDDDSREYEEGVTEDGLPLWNEGLRIAPRLPLQSRLDYSGTRIEDGTFPDSTITEAAYLPPLIIANLPDDEVLPYQLIDQMITTEEDQPRGWSCNVAVADHDAALILRVSDGRQQLLALDDFATAAETDPEHDPTYQRGVNWQDFQATLTLLGDHRVSASVEINTAPDRPQKVVYIPTQNMRLDYVVPQTVVAVEDGVLIRTTTGGYVRDDRVRLQQIADLAAAWYGRTRANIVLSVKTVDATFSVGVLVRSVGEIYDVPDFDPDFTLNEIIAMLALVELQPIVSKPVNSPITMLEWDFRNARETIETSYAELDFV